MNTTKSTDKYQSLYDLQYSLTKLFEGLDYHPNQVELKIPGKFQRTLDHYINGGVDRDFVNDLREQIDAVIDIAEGKRLDAWSAEETAKEYKKKLDEYETIAATQSDITAECNSPEDVLSQVDKILQNYLSKGE